MTTICQELREVEHALMGQSKQASGSARAIFSCRFVTPAQRVEVRAARRSLCPFSYRPEATRQTSDNETIRGQGVGARSRGSASRDAGAVPCKISIREVLISVRLNLRGEVAERLKAAVC